MASGEMSEAEYEDFLVAIVRNLIRFTVNGSVHYVFIDWRHIHELERVCRRYFTEQLNLCIWAKTNGGMGSLYRSQHELVLVYKNGTAPHINNVLLGRYGRNRTNVWTYEGVNTVNPDRRGDLELHPTVKPVALVADAIKDCSKRNGIVLDPFVGSGTTIIAAEKTGRICYAMELDPRYVDTAIRRWETFTGGTARHEGTGLTFNELTLVRHSKVPLLPPPHPGPQDIAGGGV
jgi:DNA modification methylase